MKSKTAREVDEYIKGFPPQVRKRLNEMRRAVRRAAPGATEKMAYRIPTLTLNGNLVHFAAFARHLSFFPTAAGIRAFKKELSQYKTSAGTVQFSFEEDIPFGLVSRIVKFRVAQNTKKIKRTRKAKKAKAPRRDSGRKPLRSSD